MLEVQEDGDPRQNEGTNCLKAQIKPPISGEPYEID